MALVDPPNKQRVTGQTPKRLTYAQADRAISSLAAHFIESGLPANSVIAVQLPNTIEFALTMLAAYRAGLVVAVLPLLWRQSELTMALNRTAARAIVTTSKVDGIVYADLAMNAAAEAFSIRHVCGFGDRSAGGHGLARQRDPAGIHHRARGHPGRPQGGADLVRPDVGRFPPRPARPSRPDRGRTVDVARKRRAAGRDDPVGVFADVVCRPRVDADGLAAVGRNAGAAPSVRRRGAGAADQRVCLRHADRAGATGVAAGRTRPRRQPAELAQRHRPVARAGTGDVERVLVGPAGDADRRLSVRRSRFVRRAPDRATTARRP